MDTKKNLFVNFVECVEKNEKKPAIYYQNKVITYKELLQKVYRIAYFFKSIDLKSDDLITLVAPNIPESVACFYAASMMNLRIHLLHPLTIEKNILKELKEKNSKLLITTSLFLNKYHKILNTDIPLFVLHPTSSLNFIQKKVFNRTNKKQLETYFSNKQIYKYDDYKNTYTINREYYNTKGRIYLSSGGSTSTPKTIILSDYSFVSLISNTPEILNIKTEEIKNKTMVAALPMFHGFGLAMGILALLNYGGSISLMPKFNTKPIIKLLKQNRANIIIGVPIMFEALLKNKNFHGKILKNIDVCFIGGDFISPSLLERFNKRLKENNSKGMLLEGYGLTETVTVLSVNTLDNHRINSVGKPLKNIDVKILDDDNKILPPLEKGEIAISGDTLMEGYFEGNNPFITIKNKKYVKSGDLGYLDQDNYLYFVSRKKRIIKKRGFNIFPLSIEKHLSSLDYIEECAYLNKNNGKEEITYLFVNPIKNQSEDLIREKIKTEFKNNFQSYEMPDKIIFLNDFKKTNVGKTDYVYLISLIKE